MKLLLTTSTLPLAGHHCWMQSHSGCVPDAQPAIPNSTQGTAAQRVLPSPPHPPSLPSPPLPSPPLLTLGSAAHLCALRSTTVSRSLLAYISRSLHVSRQAAPSVLRPAQHSTAQRDEITNSTRTPTGCFPNSLLMALVCNARQQVGSYPTSSHADHTKSFMLTARTQEVHSCRSPGKCDSDTWHSHRHSHSSTLGMSWCQAVSTHPPSWPPSP